jgi:hypothetical protein
MCQRYYTHVYDVGSHVPGVLKFSEGGWVPEPPPVVVVHAGERVLSNDMREA